jgi:DNA-binding transcriptional MerR regulator
MKQQEPEKLLYRRQEAAKVLGVSEGQLRKWEKEGVLKSYGVETVRARWYRGADIRSLAANISFGRLSTESIETT